MAIVSFRIYCTECNEETVLRKDKEKDSNWKVNNFYDQSAVCPECRPDMSIVEKENEEDVAEIVFEELDSIGVTAAENLRNAGFVTAGDIEAASDEDLLGVSWIGDAALESLRNFTE
jgi:DNA-directed RNA polymerase alpha subunit